MFGRLSARASAWACADNALPAVNNRLASFWLEAVLSGPVLSFMSI